MFRAINIPDRLIVMSSDLGIEAMQVAIFNRDLHLGRDIKLLVRGQKIVVSHNFFHKKCHIIISSMSIYSILNLRICIYTLIMLQSDYSTFKCW